MMYRVLILVGILSLAFSMAAFPQAPANPPAAAPPDEPPPVLSVPKDYHYNARGRRDPFVNPVPKPVQKVVAPPSARPLGLKGVLVAEAEIAGVVVSREPSMNLATITAPGGKKYFARVGDALYDAVVESIKPDGVTFALTAPGGDSRAARKVERKVHPTSGDQR
jgi:hypothetical protein